LRTCSEVSTIVTKILTFEIDIEVGCHLVIAHVFNGLEKLFLAVTDGFGRLDGNNGLS
jgi:hypothetical protein